MDWCISSSSRSSGEIHFFFVFPFLKDMQQTMVKKEQHQQQSIIVVGIPNYTLRLYIFNLYNQKETHTKKRDKIALY